MAHAIPEPHMFARTPATPPADSRSRAFSRSSFRTFFASRFPPEGLGGRASSPVPSAEAQRR